MGWSSQYFTTIIIEGNTPQTGIFIYNGTPSLGNLIGSWAAQAGTDAFGNTYPTGLNVNQGVLTGVTITQSTATVMQILASVFANGQINASVINQGQINETTIIFDTGGGVLFGYTSTTTTVSQSVNGNYNFTSPINGTASVFCIGAGAGGNGGSTTQGGGGGGAGECAGEPNYPMVNGQVYPYTVGNGGGPNSTNNGAGGDGGDTFFDIGGPGGAIFAGGGKGNGAAGSGSANSVHFDGGTGAPASGFGGGGSGGNSGNKTSKGNNGIPSVSNTHGGSPVPQSGSGTGGAGSDSGTSPASNGGSPGAGGGGAGKGTSGGGTLTKTYEASFTAAFYGPDANASVANKVRSTSTLYQGGETAGGGGFNGNMRSVMVFPSNTIAADFAGYTPSNAVLKLVNQHSWYNSGMLIDIDVPLTGGKINSPPSTWPDDLAGGGPAFTLSIGEGQTKSFSLGSTVAGNFINNNYNFLSMGGFVAAQAPYNLSYYGYFTGGHNTSLLLTISGTITTSGSNTSGSGADGNVTIIYSTSSILGMALAPVAGSDVGGNAYAAGYTGPVSAFQPATNPTAVEVWHAIPMDVGWTTVAGFNTPSYRMLSNGDIEFSGAASHAAFGGSTQNFNGSNPLPTAYRPVNTHVWRTGNGGTVADSEYLSTGVIVGLGTAGTTVRIYLDGSCPLN